jgi:hypothetical protein
MRGSPTAELFFDNVEIPEGVSQASCPVQCGSDGAQRMCWETKVREQACSCPALTSSD